VAAVTIVIPTRDRPDFLGMALQSIDAQSYRDFHILVRDNASTQNNRSVIANYPHLPITYVRSDQPLPQTENIAAGLKLCKSRYIAVLCDDDLWHPQFLEKLTTALDGSEDCVLAFSNLDLIDAVGTDLADATVRCRGYHGINLLRPGYIRPFEQVATVFRSISFFSGCVFRREILESIEFPKDMSVVSDTYLCFIAARHGGSAYYTAEHLFRIRYHDGTVSAAGAIDNSNRIRRHESLAILWDALARDSRAKKRSYYAFRRAVELILLARARTRDRSLKAIRPLLRRCGGPISIGYLMAYPYHYYAMRQLGLQRRLLP